MTEPTPIPTPGPTPSPAPEQTWPANTPVENMTAEQQSAYWRHQSQRHENRAKGNYDLLKTLGVTTIDEAKALLGRAQRGDDSDAASATEIEKREKAARETASAEALAKHLPQLAETAFRVAMGNRGTAEERDDFLGDLNLTRFVDEDGTVDTAKVLARVEKQFPSAKDNGKQQTPAPRGPQIPGHNPGTPAPVKPGDGARAALAKRGITVA